MLHEVQYFYILIAFALSLLVHYLVIELTHRKGIFLDEHDKVQKMHAIPTPRIGGLGIFLSSMFMLNDSQGGYFMLASIPAFIAGFLEDYSGRISPEQRLAIMCLSPIMAFIMIPDTMLTQWPMGRVPAVGGILGSVFFIIALVNGVNFTDGQNGLASGTTLISFLTLAVLAYVLGDGSLLYICLILSVAVLAFLIYNFPRGRIFLGDGGAYLLGFMAAIIAIVTVQRYSGAVSPFLLPAVVIYPLWEVLFSTLRKSFFDRISPFRSDDYHLHQLIYRNRARGKGYRPAVFILPAQVVTAFFVILLHNSAAGLLGTMFLYVLLYCTVYVHERRVDGLKNRIARA
ncbi:glycosyltransferase family 4 protein [Taibaiella koreensis]|uniref:glycosyltransferase family 4 protein n=1 Tax=Taibaiella koreensis TaxID=1268548 RepID=UPI0013C2DC3D|nr:MraY family glycosyltransferase [Taibaiella koreensis]